MKFTATQAKQKFGKLFEAAHRGTVYITKNGNPRLAIVTAERMDELLKREAAYAAQSSKLLWKLDELAREKEEVSDDDGS